MIFFQICLYKLKRYSELKGNLQGTIMAWMVAAYFAIRVRISAEVCSSLVDSHLGYTVNTDWQSWSKWNCILSFYQLNILLHSLSLNSETCANSGEPENGQRNGNNFQHGRRVTYSCNGNRKLVGSPTAICNDGVWSSLRPSCLGKTNPSYSVYWFVPASTK